MALRVLALSVGLVLAAAPAWAFDENESSETTVLARLAAGSSSGLALGGSESPALPHSVAPAGNSLALPEPEIEPIAPVAGCRRNPEDQVFLTN